MVHVFQVTQFPVCSLGMYWCLERSGQLLQCHLDTIFCVRRRAVLKNIICEASNVIATIILTAIANNNNNKTRQRQVVKTHNKTIYMSS